MPEHRQGGKLTRTVAQPNAEDQTGPFLDGGAETAAYGLLSVDTAQKVTGLNRVAEQLLGCTFAASLGIDAGKIFRVAPAIDSDVLECPAGYLLQAGAPCELLMSAAYGGHIKIAASARPLDGPPDHKSGCLISFRVHESEITHANFAKNYELFQTVEHNSRIHYHDMNNTLAGALGNVELAGISLGRTESPRFVRYIKNIAKSIRSATDKIYSMQVQMRNRSRLAGMCDMTTIAEHTTNDLRGYIPASINLSLANCDTPLIVKCDGRSVHNILINICVHAIENMPLGGTLNIHLGKNPAGLGHGAHGNEMAMAFIAITNKPGQHGPVAAPEHYEHKDRAKLNGSDASWRRCLIDPTVRQCHGSIDVEYEPDGMHRTTLTLPLAVSF